MGTKGISRHETVLEINKLVREGKLSMSDLSDKLKEGLEQSVEVVSESIISEFKQEIIDIGGEIPDGFELVIRSDRSAEIREDSRQPEGTGVGGGLIDTPSTKSEDTETPERSVEVESEPSTDQDEDCEIARSYQGRGVTELIDLKDYHVRLFTTMKAFIEDGEPVPSTRQLANLTDVPIGSIGKYVSDLIRVGLITKPSGLPNSHIKLTEKGEEIEFEEDGF